MCDSGKILGSDKVAITKPSTNRICNITSCKQSNHMHTLMRCLVHMVGAFYDVGTSFTMVLENMDQGHLVHLLGFDQISEVDNNFSTTCYCHDGDDEMNRNYKYGTGTARLSIPSQQLRSN